MNKVYVVTKNSYKIRDLKKELEKHNIKVEQIPEDTFEIQAESCEEIASFSAKNAANKFNKPIVKGDFGFFVECLNGLPGTYVKEFVNKLGVKKFLELIKNEKNRKAYLSYALAYCEPGKEAVVFNVKFNGKISNDLKSTPKWLTDAFIIDGTKMTMGEYRDLDREDELKFYGAVDKKFAEWYLQNKLNKK